MCATVLSLLIFLFLAFSAVSIPLDLVKRSWIAYPLKNGSGPVEKPFLPDYVKPIQYTVNISLALDQPTKIGPHALYPFTFMGQMVMILEVTKPTKSIALNAKELELPTDLRSYKVQRVDGPAKWFNVTVMEVNGALDLVNFTIAPELCPGKYSFSIPDYKGQIPRDNDRMQGLYYSEYFTSSGTKKYVASTQFEAQGARLVFPCVDQPNAKAKWSVHASAPTPNRMILNGQHDRNTSVTYTEIPTMASYLVAMATGDFASKKRSLTSINGSHLEIRTWTRPDVIEQSAWALHCASKAIEFYERSFRVSFINDLKEFHMVSVPRQHSAMENWALIIFEEELFLFDEERDDFELRKKVCNVVSHEISHHWFGDLVTMSHWKNLFLNEGFATLMGFDALKATVNSSVDPDAEFIRLRMPQAFEVDSASTSPPISYGNDTVPEGFVKEIVYNKGACVLRMFKYILGGFDNFAEALGIYVNKFRYGNVEYTDLLNVLSESYRKLTPGNTTLDFMKFGLSWIEQPGFPLVSVVRLNTTHVHLSQKRFLRQGDEPESPPKEKWLIPIWYQVEGVDKDIVWLNDESMDLEISDNQNFLVDPRTYGFYRVKYSNELLAQIGDQLQKNHTAIEPIARARVLDDTFHMAEAGLVPHQTALELSSYAVKETDDLPAITVLKHLDRLQAEFLDSESDEVDRANASEDPVEKHKENFLNNIRSHTEEHSQKTFSNRGLEKKSFTDNALSKVIAKELRETQHNATIAKDIETFQEEFFKPCSDIGEGDFLPRNGCSRVPFASRHYVYCQGVRHGGPPEFGLVLRIYQKEYMSATEKRSLLNALTCSQNETALKWLLNEATKKNGEFSIVDSSRIFQLIALNRPVGKRLLFNWVLENWEDVCRRFKDEVRQLGKVLGASLSRSTAHAIQTLTTFIKHHPKASHLHALKPLLNRLKKKREFVGKTSSALLEWFAKQKY